MKQPSIEEIIELIKSHNIEFKAAKTVLDLMVKCQNVILQKKQITVFENKISQLKFYCFLSTSFLDLLCVFKSIKQSTLEWEKIHFSKTAYLLIYEIIKNYDSNKKLIFLEIQKSFPKLIPLYNKNSELLADFKKDFDYDGKIKFVRHKSSGHIDKDFLNYYKAISSIEFDECLVAVENCIGFLKLTMMILHDLTLGTTEDEISNPHDPNKEYWAIVREEMKDDPQLRKFV